jgi:hypothetical protein
MLYPSYRPSAAQTANSTLYLQGLTFAGGTTIDEEGQIQTSIAPRRGLWARSLSGVLRTQTAFVGGQSSVAPADRSTNQRLAGELTGWRPTWKQCQRSNCSCSSYGCG